MKFRSILALTDLSVDADRAVRRAARLAADHGAELRLLHLSSGAPAPSGDPLARLQRRARRLARQHGFAVDVVAGAASSVDDVARHRERADLIVLHDGRRSLPWPLRGRGLTERLADRTGLPVLAVGPFSLTIPAIPSLNINAPGFSDVVDFLEDSYNQFGRVANGLQRILNIGDFAESAQRLAAETAGLAQDVGDAFTTRAGPLRTLLTALAVWLGLMYIVLLYERLARGWKLLLGRP